MMRAVTLLLALGLLAAPLPAEAQRSGKVYTIGYLDNSGRRSYYEAFAQGLRELGYVDYKDFVLERRTTETQVGTRLADVAAELVGLKVDLIVADSTAAALVAKNTTRTIPIVAITGDPIGSGLVSNFARPGGNLTAVSTLSRELNVERLELLKEAAPNVTRVAVLRDWADTGGASDLEEMQFTARVFGVTLILLETRGPADFWRAFDTATKEHVDGLIVTLSFEPLASLWFGRVLDFAEEKRLPTIYSHSEVPRIGGLMSYGLSVTDLMRRVAVYVDKILKGTKPGDLPVEQPTKFELVVNLKTAKALGLTMPPSVLVRADRVIE